MRIHRAALLIGLVFGAAGVAKAQSLLLTHVESLYDDGQGRPLSAPEGVACTADAVVIADTGNGRLVQFAHNGGLVKNGRVFKVREVSHPVRLALKKDGGIIVLDRKSSQLVELSSMGRFIRRWTASDKQKLRVSAFAVDAQGELRVLDGSSGRVLHTDANGNIRSVISSPSGPGIMADIAVDDAGNVYGVMNVERQILVARRGATQFTSLGKGGISQLDFAAALSVDTRSRALVVVDQNQHSLLIWGLDGGFRGKVLRFGWREGMLRYPGQICFSGRGEVFVTDRQNNRVQVFSTAAATSAPK